MLGAIDLYDVLSVAGAALVLYGVSQWSQPAAYVLAGLMLLALGLSPILAAGRREAQARRAQRAVARGLGE